MPAASHGPAGLTVDSCGLKRCEEGGFKLIVLPTPVTTSHNQFIPVSLISCDSCGFWRSYGRPETVLQSVFIPLRKGIARFVRLLVRRFMAASLDPAPCLFSGSAIGW